MIGPEFLPKYSYVHARCRDEVLRESTELVEVLETEVRPALATPRA